MKTIIIRKIPPLDDFKKIVPKRFGRFPQLYLELLENKNKVRPSRHGKEFVPTTPPYNNPTAEKPSEHQNERDKSSISNTPIQGDDRHNNPYGDRVPSSSLAGVGPKRTITVTNVKTVKSSSISGMNGRNRLYDDDDLFDDNRYRSPKPFQGKPIHANGPAFPGPERERQDDIKLIPKAKHVPTLTRVEEGSPQGKDERGYKEGENKKTEIDQKKQSILNEGEGEKRGQRASLKERERGGVPPSIKEIENKREEDNENEEDKKREIMFKLQLLQKQYPLRDIPEFTIRSEYKSMKKTYDIIVKQLSVDSSVESYKNYLVGGFMVCEMVFGRMGFDMEGFTQQQLLSMNSYEKLLLELGEKTYTPAGMDKWPVEIRLALAIFFNAVWFIAAKMIMKKTKINILSLFNTTRGTGGTSRSGTAPNTGTPNWRAQDASPEFNFIGRNGLKNKMNTPTGDTPVMKGPSINRADDEGFGSDEGRNRSGGIETHE
jgi:hypothetical protein